MRSVCEGGHGRIIGIVRKPFPVSRRRLFVGSLTESQRFQWCPLPISIRKFIVKGRRVAIQNDLSGFFDFVLMQRSVLASIAFAPSTTSGRRGETLTVELQTSVERRNNGEEN